MVQISHDLAEILGDVCFHEKEPVKVGTGLRLFVRIPETGEAHMYVQTGAK